MPKTVGTLASALKDDCFIVNNVDTIVAEMRTATRVTELTDGKKGTSRELQKNVNFACCEWQGWCVDFGFVCRLHDAAIWASDFDGISCWAFVDDGHVDSSEMDCAATVKDGFGLGGGGTR